jgi:hypothetical protein
MPDNYSSLFQSLLNLTIRNDPAQNFILRFFAQFLVQDNSRHLVKPLLSPIQLADLLVNFQILNMRPQLRNQRTHLIPSFFSNSL